MGRFDELERGFRTYRQAHPDVNYARFWAIDALASVRAGAPHSTLGSRLLKHEDWWEGGARAFARYRRLFPIREDSRVVDFGCGSLRIGAHLIRFLPPEHYFGLDVSGELIDIGKQLIGDLLDSKRPRFAEIDQESVTAAASFGPDIVLSTAVCYHVHPDELGTYFGHLKSLTCKPGATLFFDACLSDEASRSNTLSWPMTVYTEGLAPLEFVKWHKTAGREEDGNRSTVGILEFRRGAE